MHVQVMHELSKTDWVGSTTTASEHATDNSRMDCRV